MATAAVSPSGGVVGSSGTISYTGGSGNYINLKDASDTTYAGIAGVSAYAIWPILSNMPADIATVTGISVDIRCSRETKGDFSSPTTVQIFKSDGTTAISGSVAIGTVTATPTTFTIAPSVTLTDQTSWNDACIKVLTDSGTLAASIYEINVTITYTASAGGSANGSFLPWFF